MSKVKTLHESYSGEDILSLKGFTVLKIEDGVSEETEHISIEFIGPNGEQAILIIEDAVLFYGNELEEVGA